MTIRFKSWAAGSSVPGTWTSLTVDTCYPRYVRKSYQGVQGIDGAQATYRRRYLAVTITIGPAALSNSTNATSANALADATFARIEDARHASLGVNNTVDFTVVSASSARAGESMITETITIELETTGVL